MARVPQPKSSSRMGGTRRIQRNRARRARRASSLNAGSDRSERTASRPRLRRGDPGFILLVGRPPEPAHGSKRYRHLSQLGGRTRRRLPPPTAPPPPPPRRAPPPPGPRLLTSPPAPL